MQVSALGLEDAAQGARLRRPAGAPARRGARPAAATVPRAVPSGGGAGGGGAEVHKLQSFLVQAAPQQQGLQAAPPHDALQAAAMPALPVLLAPEQWGQVRFRRHMRLRRNEVELPSGAAPGQALLPQLQATSSQQQPQVEPDTAQAAEQQAEAQQAAAPTALEAAAAVQQHPEEQQQAAQPPTASQHRSTESVATQAAEQGGQQLAALQQLSAQQLANLRQAAWVAQQQVGAASSWSSEQAARLLEQSSGQLASLQQAAGSWRSTLHRSSQQAVQQQRHVQRPTAQRLQVQHAVAAPQPPAAELAPARAAIHGGLAQWALLTAPAGLALVLGALRWARSRRRAARSPQEEIREAEQRARAARLYDRQRQRFQRALLAAEDLEGADGSVFAAVSRKGHAAPPGAVPAALNGAVSAAGLVNGSGAASGGGSSSSSSASSAAGAHGCGADDGAVATAAPVAAATEQAYEDDGYEADGSTDVFDPASWDEQTRKQWDAFVSSSKVNKGKLWDSSQVDEFALPEVWVDLNRD